MSDINLKAAAVEARKLTGTFKAMAVVSEALEKFASLEDHASGLKSKITKLQEEVAGIESEIGSANAKVIQAETRAAEVAKSADTHKAVADQFATDKMNEARAEAKKIVAAAKKKQDARVKEADTAISEKQAVLDGILRNIEEEETRLADVKSSISKILESA